MNSLVTVEGIQKRIFLLRGQKVMLDVDLAQLYGVMAGRLNEAVKRNRDRFPSDFMFQPTKQNANTCNRKLRYQVQDGEDAGTLLSHSPSGAWRLGQPASPGRRIGFGMKSRATGKPKRHRR